MQFIFRSLILYFPLSFPCERKEKKEMQNFIPGSVSFSSPEASILVVSATDRDLWLGPKQEVRESRTCAFCAQPQKFETITVTIGYKSGQLLCLRVTLAPTRGLDPWRWPKGSQLWGREWIRLFLANATQVYFLQTELSKG